MFPQTPPPQLLQLLLHLSVTSERHLGTKTRLSSGHDYLPGQRIIHLKHGKIIFLDHSRPSDRNKDTRMSSMLDRSLIDRPSLKNHSSPYQRQQVDQNCEHLCTQISTCEVERFPFSKLLVFGIGRPDFPMSSNNNYIRIYTDFPFSLFTLDPLAGFAVAFVIK